MPRRRQKVVLRSKVRQERWSRAGTFALRLVQVFFLGGALFFGWSYAKRFLFQSDFFMIQWVKVEPENGELSSLIQEALSAQRGRSIFKISPEALEKNLAARFPTARSVSISRRPPNALKARFVPRRAAAWVKDAGNGSALLLDQDGSFYPDRAELKNGLPQAMVSSTVSAKVVLDFFKQWSAISVEDPAHLSTQAVRAVSMDAYGDLTLHLDNALAQSSGTMVLWGAWSADTFQEKFDRFQDVWADLRQKNMKVSYVNLTDVPRKDRSALGDRELVGRVVVRPIESKPAAVLTRAVPAQPSHASKPSRPARIKR